MDQRMERPENTLADEPAVTSIEEIDAALAELHWLDTETRRVDADLNQKVAALQEKAAEKLAYGEPDARITFATRWALLVNAVTAFAAKSRKLLLGDGKLKSRKFALGAIAFRDVAPKLEPTSKKKTLDQLLDEFLEEHEVKKYVTQRLNKVLGKDLSLGDLIRVDYSFNVAALKSQFENQTLTAEQLAMFGLVLKKQPEAITVKVGT